MANDVLGTIDFKVIKDLSMPLCLHARGGSYVTVREGQEAMVFGYGTSFQKNLQLDWGLNLLSPILFKLKQHAFLTDMHQTYSGFHLLQVADVMGRAGVEEVERGANDMARMSASMTYSHLFFDKDVRRLLKMEEMEILGDALSFAWWKEGLEYEILLQKSDFKLTYATDVNIGRFFFKKFHEGDLVDLQKKGIYGPDVKSAVKPLLQISPWCSIALVQVQLVKHKESFGQIQSEVVRQAFSEIMTSGTWEEVMQKYATVEKRTKEDQYLLGLAAARLKSKGGEIFELCNQLKRYSQVLDQDKTFGTMKKDIMTWGGKFHAEGNLTQMGGYMEDKVSGGIAGIISKTMEKLALKLLHTSSVIVPIIGYFWFIHQKGFFKYAKGSITSAVHSVVHRMILP